MKLATCFKRLPLRLDMPVLQREVMHFAESDWRTHTPHAAGQESILLVSVGGQLNHDFAQSGALKATPLLQACPAVQSVLAQFNNPISRCRLTRLPAMTHTPVQQDWHYHWFRRTLVYIPIIAQEKTLLFCQKKSQAMTVGDAWLIDNSRPHRMFNRSAETCVHLVIEIKGIPELVTQPVSAADSLRLESDGFEVLTPSEFAALNNDIQTDLRHADAPPQLIAQVAQTQPQWQAAFARFGHHLQGELAYQDVILQFREDMAKCLNAYLPPDGAGRYALTVINSMLATAPPAGKRLDIPLLVKKRRKKRLKYRLKQQSFQMPVFERPIFIVSAPRSGSTLLFNTLTRFIPELWTIAEESHGVIESVAAFHPVTHNYQSNRLTEADAQADAVALLKQGFVRELQNQAKQAYLDLPPAQRPQHIRFLEKTPKNAFRIPFFKAAFPDALFIYLHRAPQENISSLVEGWRSRRYIAYQPLPGWPYKDWSFLLPSGWEALTEASLFEIAAFQWKMSNTCIEQDLQKLAKDDYCVVDYSDLVHSPSALVKTISEFAGLTPVKAVEQLCSRSLPVSSSTLSAPATDKWRKNAFEIEQILTG